MTSWLLVSNKQAFESVKGGLGLCFFHFFSVLLHCCCVSILNAVIFIGIPASPLKMSLEEVVNDVDKYCMIFEF